MIVKLSIKEGMCAKMRCGRLLCKGMTLRSVRMGGWQDSRTQGDPLQDCWRNSEIKQGWEQKEH